MKKNWWKILCALLLIYTVIGGFLFKVPRLPINNETTRNLYFHVPMWFGMIIILTISMIYAIRNLRFSRPNDDLVSNQAAQVGVGFGIIGLLTGMLWAKYTWGAYWHGDVKQLTSAISILIYLAYFVLRASLVDEQQRARISGIYNIFAYALLIPLLFILPRMTDSMHPSNGGNPGFNSYDLDRRMRLVFYPAVIAWTLLGWWVVTLRVRIEKVYQKLIEQDEDIYLIENNS